MLVEDYNTYESQGSIDYISYEDIYNLYDLHNYQVVQNTAVRNAAKKGFKRIISCISTGSGKSLMLADIVVGALKKMKTVVIVLPRRNLVKQLSKSFTGWGINHGIVMSGERRFTQPRCQIMSIDTYLSRVSSEKMGVLMADILIIDELQLQFSPRKLEIFGQYPLVIAFSATPVAPKKQSLGLFYDHIVETISMTDLIEQGYLTPLKYYAKPGLDLSMVATNADGDWRESQLGNVMDKPKLVGDIFKNWVRICPGESTVIFASSQSHARHLANEFSSNGYRFEYVDCNTPDDERDEIFDKIKSGESIGVVNVGIISVGIDIPNLKVCILARPTKLVDYYLQCVGRVTRLFKGKDFGIVIDHAGIIERLGFPTDYYGWSLDGKELISDRVKKEKEEKKEPKEIICEKCNLTFRLSRKCPECGHEIIPIGKKLPVHEAKLEEVKKVEITENYKEQFYRELFGYSKQHKKWDGWIKAKYEEKFKESPYWTTGPLAPSSETIKWVVSTNIRKAYRNKKRKAA